MCVVVNLAIHTLSLTSIKPTLSVRLVSESVGHPALIYITSLVHYILHIYSYRLRHQPNASQ